MGDELRVRLYRQAPLPEADLRVEAGADWLKPHLARLRRKRRGVECPAIVVPPRRLLARV